MDDELKGIAGKLLRHKGKEPAGAGAGAAAADEVCALVYMSVCVRFSLVCSDL